MKTVIYARVSSSNDVPSINKQIEALKHYADTNDCDICKVFFEYTMANREINVLTECLECCKVEQADTLMVSSLSKLGRSASEVQKTVEDMTKEGVNIFILDLNLSTLDQDGKENSVFNMVLNALNLGAKMERKLILGRLNNGRTRAIEEGVKMGRPKGSSMSDEDVLQKYHEVVTLLSNKEHTLSEIADLASVSLSTVQRVHKVKKRNTITWVEIPNKHKFWDDLYEEPE